MNDLSLPLTDAELGRLARLLLDHVEEDAVTEVMAEGIPGISGLDGFFTAIVSSARSMPGDWRSDGIWRRPGVITPHF